MEKNENGGWGEYPMAEISETKEGYLCRSDMTLRDYFAGQASDEDIKAHMKWVEKRGAPLGVGNYDCSREQARYRFADAMLEARRHTNHTWE